MANILVVDDEKSMRDYLRIMLTKEGYEVQTATTGKDALEKLKIDPYDLIVTDLKMPEMDGMTLLKEVTAKENAPAVIVITAFHSIQTGLEAVSKGAYHYISKPFKNEELKLAIRKALDEREGISKSEEELDQSYLERLVGGTKAFKEVKDLIIQIANQKTTVLIHGETGTGKEVVAKAIHYCGIRRNQRFVAINCGVFPETLLESELFGFEKGAFTGADRSKPGRFEIANGGTLFLDEIESMPPSIQFKLLRFLQDKEFERLGSNETVKVDVRIIAASNKSLPDLVAKDVFRKDLFYRLNVVTINIPPLRERKEDIPVLTRYFLKKFERPDCEISNLALEIFMVYDWPGNVRELENVIERSLVMQSSSPDKIILPFHLPSRLLDKLPEDYKKQTLPIPELPSSDFSLEEYLDQIEQALLKQALEKADGNLADAAQLLGLKYRSLRHRLAKFRIDKDYETQEGSD